MKLFHDSLKTFKEVFSQPGYSILTLAVFVIILYMAVWLPNITNINDIFFTDTFSLSSKIKLFLSGIGALNTNFTPISRITTILIAFLLGINISFLVKYMKRQAQFVSSSGISTIGALIGMLGIGCASCGSVVITAIFGIGVTAQITGILPFDGLEFSFIGIAAILFSLGMLSHKIQSPKVCDIRNHLGFLRIFKKGA